MTEWLFLEIGSAVENSGPLDEWDGMEVWLMDMSGQEGSSGVVV